MARNWTSRGIFIPLSLALVSGCPATCQQQRVKTDEQKWKIQIGETKIEDQDRQILRKPKTIRHLRPDGTPWKIETDGGELLTEKLKISTFTNSSNEGERNLADVVVTRPWWYWPIRILTGGVIGGILALVIYLGRKIRR